MMVTELLAGEHGPIGSELVPAHDVVDVAGVAVWRCCS